MDWVPLSLFDTKDALQRFTGMEDRGLWLCGFHFGASGAILMGGEAQAMLDGYALGSSARADAEMKRAHISNVRSDVAKAAWEARKNAIADAKVNAIASANTEQLQMQNVCTRQDKTRQDRTEKTEQVNTPKPPKGRVTFDPSEFDSMIPARIYSEESIEAWHQYAEHRRGKRAKLTELAVNLILKEFATATPKVFSDALRTSVANGWTGVFLGGSRPQAQQITMHPTANRPLRPDEMP